VAAPAPDPDAFAALVCDWCIEAARGDQVLVNVTPQSLELMWALHAALLARGAWPLIRFSASALAEEFYAHARSLHLDGFPAAELAETQAADAVISITAPANTRAVAGVDPVLLARAARARAPL